jgi:hypothetical protein
MAAKTSYVMSSPSCAGAQASFRTVRCHLMMATHNYAGNKPSCASAQAINYGSNIMSMTRPSVQAQGIYIASLDGNNDNNYGDDDDKCQQQGLGRVDNKASCASARHFHIASRKCDNNNNNWRRQMTSVRQQGLVHECTT